jgi:hypothetical protein
MYRQIAILILAFAGLSVSASAGVRVVSDIDDTTKITDVGSSVAAAWNTFFSTRAFTGMTELYSTLAIERGYSFDYLTAAPRFLSYRVHQFLDDNRFPPGEVHLRSGSGGIREYKVRELKKIFLNHPDDQFILVGDDTQHDFEAYDDLYRAFPDRILAIYIRQITNRPLPPSAYPFLSAFEIARTEYLMGRLQVAEIAPAAIAIISDPRDRRIVPRFAYCPPKKFFLFSDPKVDKWNETISDRIQAICKTRSPFEN